MLDEFSDGKNCIVSSKQKKDKKHTFKLARQVLAKQF